MHLMLICAFLLTVVVSLRSTNAAASYGFYTDPAHPGKCVIKPDLILSEGDKVRNPKEICGTISCGRNGETYFVSCGVMAPPKGCKYTDYLHLDQMYPQCCEQRLECPNES